MTSKSLRAPDTESASVFPVRGRADRRELSAGAGCRAPGSPLAREATAGPAQSDATDGPEVIDGVYAARDLTDDRPAASTSRLINEVTDAQLRARLMLGAGGLLLSWMEAADVDVLAVPKWEGEETGTQPRVD